jgi:hypothetical protein
MIMHTTNQHPKMLALTSAACITAALLLGVSMLFANSAHAFVIMRGVS